MRCHMRESSVPDSRCAVCVMACVSKASVLHVCDISDTRIYAV